MGITVSESVHMFLTTLLLGASFIAYVSMNADTFEVRDYLTKDWHEQPLIYVQVAKNGSCPDDTVPIFNRTWLGTEPGCNCIGVTTRLL